MPGARSRRRLGRLPGTILTALACAGAAQASDPRPPLMVRIPDPAVSAVVQRGVLAAIDRLERSESCRAVFQDFASSSGEPLQAVLAGRGQTAGQHLAGLLFLDGSPHPRCRSGRVAAYTAPGWKVVFVCAATFRARLLRSASEVEAIVIHEALHTLGLGENPPTPRDIQERVARRCLAAR